MSAHQPASQTERAVAGIWRDVLDLPSVGAGDNFFDLGGHSMLLHVVQQRIASDLGRDIPVTELFEFPTIRALARHLDAADRAEVSP